MRLFSPLRLFDLFRQWRAMLLYAAVVSPAQAECAVEWDRVVDSRVDGYWFEVNGQRTQKISKGLTRATCEQAGAKPGRNVVRLYAYGSHQISGPSNSLCIEIKPDSSYEECDGNAPD